MTKAAVKVDATRLILEPFAGAREDDMGIERRRAEHVERWEAEIARNLELDAPYR